MISVVLCDRHLLSAHTLQNTHDITFTHFLTKINNLIATKQRKMSKKKKKFNEHELEKKKKGTNKNVRCRLLQRIVYSRNSRLEETKRQTQLIEN